MRPCIKIALILMVLNISVVLSYSQSIVNTGNLRLHQGAEVTFFGNFINNGSFIDSGGMVTLMDIDSISGDSVTSFNNVIVSSGVTLMQSIIVRDSLVLSSGAFNLNAKTLTINNSDPDAIKRTTGYLVSEQTDNSGKVAWNIGSNTGTYVYPFGTSSGKYIPLTVALTSGDVGSLTVSTYPTDADNTPYPSAPDSVLSIGDTSLAVDRFWQIDKSGPSGTLTVTFTARSEEVGNLTGLQMQRWNSATQEWDDPLPGQTASDTSVTVPGITSFSPWMMSGSGGGLPIELLSFDAIALEGNVHLDWTTATEINNDYFIIERSKEAIHFEPLDTINGAGNSSSLRQYTSIDKSPYSGISYYRLKQTDFDGKFEYSPLRSVNIEPIESNLQIFPNPVTGDIFFIKFDDLNEVQLSDIVLTDLCGRKVMDVATSEYNELIKVRLANHCKPGIYLLSLPLRSFRLIKL